MLHGCNLSDSLLRGLNPVFQNKKRKKKVPGIFFHKFEGGKNPDCSENRLQICQQLKSTKQDLQEEKAFVIFVLKIYLKFNVKASFFCFSLLSVLNFKRDHQFTVQLQLFLLAHVSQGKVGRPLDCSHYSFFQFSGVAPMMLLFNK